MNIIEARLFKDYERLSNLADDLEGVLFCIAYAGKETDRNFIKDRQKEISEYHELIHSPFYGSKTMYNLGEAYDQFMIIDIDKDPHSIQESAEEILQIHLISPAVLAEEEMLGSI